MGFTARDRVEDARRAIDGLDLRGALFMLRPKLKSFIRHGESVLTFSINVPDRDNPLNWIVVENEVTINIYPRDPRDFADKIIKPLIMSLIRHELDEGIWFRGQQLEDPHEP